MHPSLSKYLVHRPYYLLRDRSFSGLRREFEATQSQAPDRLQERQWDRLQRILAHAYQSIPFYKRTFDEHGVAPSHVQAPSDLLKLPILTKDDIREHFTELICPSAAGGSFPRHTSGSTGSPLRLLKDRTVLQVMDSIMYRNYGWFDIEMGQKQARFWGSPASRIGRTKDKLTDLLVNRIRFSPFDISDEACGRFVAAMMRFRPDYVYGYAQTISRFSDYVARQDVDRAPLHLKAVIVTGEVVLDEQLGNIRAAFQCPVSNEYGCTEVGIVAMGCPNGRMHLMIENLFVEFMKDHRHTEPLEEGEILLTELYGGLMPLIRYRVGDMGAADDRLCECGRGLPLLHRIVGRSDEFIVCPGGKQVDPIVFENILKEMPAKLGKVTQFRIVQEPGFRLTIDLCYSGSRSERLIPALREKLESFIGPEFDIEFHLRDTIPPEASGKLRCFISRI